MKKLIFLFLGLVVTTFYANCMALIPETDEELYSSPVLIDEPVVVQVIDSYYLEGGLIVITEATVMPSTEESLGAFLLQVEQQLAAAEAERQSSATMFENFDNKVDQLFNLMNNILKSIREMQQSITRNLGN